MIPQSHGIEDCYGSRAHCHWHNVDEPGQGAFRVCFECNHAYATEADLVRAWAQEWPQAAYWVAGEIPGCAYCGHDW